MYFSCHISSLNKNDGESAEGKSLYDRRLGYCSSKAAQHRRRKDPLIDFFCMGFPDFPDVKPTDDVVSLLWQAADKHERANGRLCRRIMLALPRCVSHKRHRRIAKKFCISLYRYAGKRFPVCIAFHHGKKGNEPHIHVMIAERVFDGLSRSINLFFKRYNKKNPEIGGAKKINLCQFGINSKKEIRKIAENAINSEIELCYEKDLSSYEKKMTNKESLLVRSDSLNNQGGKKIKIIYENKVKPPKDFIQYRFYKTKVESNVLARSYNVELEKVKDLSNELTILYEEFSELPLHEQGERTLTIKNMCHEYPELKDSFKYLQQEKDLEKKSIGLQFMVNVVVPMLGFKWEVLKSFKIAKVFVNEVFSIQNKRLEVLCDSFQQVTEGIENTNINTLGNKLLSYKKDSDLQRLKLNLLYWLESRFEIVQLSSVFKHLKTRFAAYLHKRPVMGNQITQRNLHTRISETSKISASKKGKITNSDNEYGPNPNHRLNSAKRHQRRHHDSGFDMDI